MAGGRPPIEFTQEMADRICDRLSTGRSIRSVSEDDDTIGLTTIFKWLRDNEGFAKQYARATEIRSDMMFDDIQHIADAPYKIVKTVSKVDGDKIVETTETDTIEHRRMRIDARKWMLGKMSPKKYGDKSDVDASSVVNITVRGGLPDA